MSELWALNQLSVRSSGKEGATTGVWKGISESRVEWGVGGVNRKCKGVEYRYSVAEV